MTIKAADNLHEKLNELYNGSGRTPHQFRVGMLVIDLVCILYFVGASFLHPGNELHTIEVLIGVFYLAELGARLFISRQRLRILLSPYGLLDVVVIFSLFLPTLAENFLFLRLVRSLRLLRSYRVLGELRRQSPFVRLHEDIIFSVVNLLVFIFIITAIVYVTQVAHNPAIDNYIEALYFTVSTLTTTGFGDITLIGPGGHLLSVLIMIFGISLFLRLVQTIFRPGKVRYECPSCGLNRHDADAVHCKHCGGILHIRTEGDG